MPDAPSIYEQCRTKLEQLSAWYSGHIGERNEATTRVQLIDRLFFECLGWSREDMTAEEYHGGEFADYVFSAPRKLLIVEAKKEGDYFELPSGMDNVEYSVKTLCRDYPNLKSAIEQVADYCYRRGVPNAAVCNGHQIVAFIALRLDLPALEGRALVFPSLEFMSNHFLDLWEGISKKGIEEKKLQDRLGQHKRQQPPVKLSQSISGYPGVKGRNIVQTDLQILSEVVIEDITRSHELEERFLKECYCTSGALSQYSLSTKSILEARYSALFSATESGPTLVPATSKHGMPPDLLAESLSRRPILLIGDVGAGKSIFIRNLITIDASSITKNAIFLYIDFGSQATLSLDLRSSIFNSLIKQLRDNYGVNVEERNFVRGVYDRELKGFKTSIYGDLATQNPTLFMEKEIAFLEKKMNDRQDFLNMCLQHLSKGRKQQIIIVLDNSDQRDDQTQQEVFLISQELAERWSVMVFVALRPETFYHSKKFGALTAYHAKAYTIAPPRIDLVIQKRLAFALKITSGEIPIKSISVSLELKKLDSVIDALVQTLDNKPDIGELLDNLSGGNVRLALDLVKGFFGSGHVDTAKIIRLFDRDGRYEVSPHEFLRAVIYGDGEYYDPAQSPVANIFDIAYPDPKEHFLTPLMVGTVALLGKKETDGFIPTVEVYERLQSMGFSPDQIDLALARGCQRKLVETTARRIPKPGQDLPPSIRATTIGLYHNEVLTSHFSYVDAMIIDTPILDPRVRGAVINVQSIEDRLKRFELFHAYLTKCWEEVKSVALGFNWVKPCIDLQEEVRFIREDIVRDLERHPGKF
jgi:hypothetical protein